MSRSEAHARSPLFRAGKSRVICSALSPSTPRILRPPTENDRRSPGFYSAHRKRKASDAGFKATESAKMSPGFHNACYGKHQDVPRLLRCRQQKASSCPGFYCDVSENGKRSAGLYNVGNKKRQYTTRLLQCRRQKAPRCPGLLHCRKQKASKCRGL